MKLGVIICTHNPKRESLRKTLAGLERQTLAPSEWDLTIVDNQSSPPVETGSALGWHPSARVVIEEKLGLTHARARGLRESRGEILVLVDDDNVLDADYLAAALDLGAQWPMLGAWGGGCEPEFEAEPEAKLRPHLYILGIGRVERDEWSNYPDMYRSVPIGAGMCIRRTVFEAYLAKLESEPDRAIFDRTGSMLFSGADWDMAMTATDLGLGTGLFKRLRLVHLIGKERLDLDYLERLNLGISYSMTWIKHFRGALKVPYLENRLADRLGEWRLDPIGRRLAAARRKGFHQAWAEVKLQKKEGKAPASRRPGDE